MPHLPTMVETAQSVARALGYQASCSDSLGTLLQVLASSVVRGRLLIFGAGTGVATSWIIHCMSPYAKLIAYEPDSGLAKASRPVIGEKALVVDEPQREVLRRGPFAFIYINAARAKIAPRELVDEVVPGGMVVVGNFASDKDEFVDEWKQLDGFHGVEVMVEGREPALVLTREVV